MASEDRNAAQNPLDEVSVPHPMSKKWTPFMHTNGLAIYHHQNVVDGHEFVGGEYMISSTVKGSPEQCLAALTHRSSTTTLLGPATAVDVLSNHGNTQVLHIQLPPPSAAGIWSSLAARRYAVVEQTYSKDACGIHCLMFSSLPVQDAVELLQQHHHQHNHQQQQQQHLQHQQSSRGPQEHAQHYHHHRHHVQQQQHRPPPLTQSCSTLDGTAAGIRYSIGLASSCCDGSSSRGRSECCLGSRLWSPVLVDVAGGYTVSGLQGCDEQQSPEALVTFILKVELGGCLSPRSPLAWLHRTAVAAGLVDELRSRMLTAVSLLKDEVEQQRVTNYPSGLLQHLPADITDSNTALATRAASPCRASSSTDQHLQQQYHQQQDWHTIQSQTLPPNHGSRSSHQRCVLASGFPVSWLSWLWSWTWSAILTGFDHQHQHPQQHQAHDAQQRSPQATPQQSVDSTSMSAGSLGLDVEVIPGLQNARSFHGATESSSYSGSESAEDLVAGSAAADAYEQLVGLDEHGQPITGYCNPSFWSELHQPGGPAPFKVRGPRYLSDRVKVPAGPPAYKLLAVDLVSTPVAIHHISRYLPSVRRCRAASCVVINMMVPTSTDVMNLVMTFGSSHHWKDPDINNKSTNSSRDNFSSSDCNGLCNGGCDGDSEGSNSWSSGFEHVLRRFIHASDKERSSIFKMIPHIEVGPWVLRQTAGTTPVIMGRKLQTTYHLTHKYMEVDIDVTTCKTAGYIVQSIRGMTTSLVVDLSYLLEGQHPNELPEVLIGAVRFSNLDMSATTPLDTSREVPFWPQPWTPTQAARATAVKGQPQQLLQHTHESATPCP